jgi:proliferating cell nuclear antigen
MQALQQTTLSAEIIFPKANLIKKSVEAIASLISEAVLRIGPNSEGETGLTLTAMDLSHICLIDLFIAEEDCSTYEVQGSYELGINFEDLNKVLKRAKNEDMIALEYLTDQESLTLKVYKTIVKSEKVPVVETEEETIARLSLPKGDPKRRKPKPRTVRTITPSNKKPKVFTFDLIDIEGDEINLSSLRQMNFDCHFTIEAQDFMDNIKDCEIFAEIMQFKATSKGLIISTTGKSGGFDESYSPRDLVESDLVESEGIFAISFLRTIAKSFDVDKELSQIAVRLMTQAPLMVKKNILTSSHIQYWLAPRVEEEEAPPQAPKVPKAPKWSIGDIKLNFEGLVGDILSELNAVEFEQASKVEAIDWLKQESKKAMSEGNFDLAKDIIDQIKENNDLVSTLADKRGELLEAGEYLYPLLS